MSKFVPTTKSCDQICRLITNEGCNRYGLYVQLVFDPISTHALYGVRNDAAVVDYYKNKIKDIGGKYIRVVKANSSDYRIICFALEITPQERAQEKMREDARQRQADALEAKLREINESSFIQQIANPSELGKSRLAGYLLDSSVLDPMIPAERYVFMNEPRDKDERRIFDIVKKANCNKTGCVGMLTTERWKMIELAQNMNRKITNEDKRLNRKAACLTYGLKFLADCFA
jgi:hypothetical protein